jgi:hypothetical protein
MLWLIPILLILPLLMQRPDKQRDMSPLALRMAERFGTIETEYTTKGEQHQLELRLLGKRWQGLNDVVPDSARVVARYALEDLKGFSRPDTIVVTIRTTHKWGGTWSGSSGVHLATADL